MPSDNEDSILALTRLIPFRGYVFTGDKVRAPFEHLT